MTRQDIILDIHALTDAGSVVIEEYGYEFRRQAEKLM